ncbi:zinc ABC transporter substrate-binding protein [Acuticoccus sp. MNP-M23]|uniref:metal ABC transporter solute-binding protein, Zn/Mn family n=1 Tax=Acuticoccus sp. MNP-M23 TaxID=3072793 RepID=UPI0028167344|nr:zinc ABC transporter substrate-binding protein [Acuticoccus sp. MNP-M23]WMS42484.1 zinc ABC transporter substrate-binding protein [Acuticoccus sp. MNP-M23]
MKFLLSAVAACALLGASAASAEPLRVVATMPILADMTRNVAGDRANVTSLVGETGDPHVFRPAPRDAQSIAEADLLVVNGLQLEGWIDRLKDSSGYEGPVVVATANVEPIPADSDGHDAHSDEHAHEHEAHADEHEHDADEHGHEEHAEHAHEAEAHADHAEDHGHHHGAFDPHAWHSLENGALYAAVIADGLISLDPEGADIYRANLARYVARMEALHEEIAATFAQVPDRNRLIVTNHDAFAYFGRDYGLRFEAPVGLSTDAEPSATDMARIITEIRADGVKAVFLEAGSDPRLSRQIAAETDARIGGTLYAGTLSGPDGPASSYLAMMAHNAQTIAAEIGPHS